MLEAVSEADVVITNPEHFAVALAYDPPLKIPRVVAKGSDSLLRGFGRGLARRSALFQSPVLARALFFTTELEGFIPEPLLRLSHRSLLTFLISTASIDLARHRLSLYLECQMKWSLIQKVDRLRSKTRMSPRADSY